MLDNSLLCAIIYVFFSVHLNLLVKMCAAREAVLPLPTKKQRHALSDLGMLHKYTYTLPPFHSLFVAGGFVSKVAAATARLRRRRQLACLPMSPFLSPSFACSATIQFPCADHNTTKVSFAIIP